MQEKLCPKCKIVKKVSEFHVNNATKSGLRCHCKKCCSDYRKTHYKANSGKYIAYTKKWGNKNIAKRRAYGKTYKLRIKMLIFTHYGKKCECCGETELEFLTVDHILGGGTKHRRKAGGGFVVYGEIIKQNYPSCYRILCRNCNWATRLGKTCPHKALAKVEGSKG